MTQRAKGDEPLNYRHHFHAGNFADVMKHAILIALIEAARAKGPVRLFETHAGAGLYDLMGPLATRGGEAEAGIMRLMTAGDAPPSLLALRALVEAENKGGPVRLYPGSPMIAAGLLTRGEHYLGCELRPDDHDALRRLLAGRKVAADLRALQVDGYEAMAAEVGRSDLVLIDPPYEREDDYDRAAAAVAACIEAGAAVAVWAPIKDLETLDGFLRRLEALAPRSLVVAQVRLRPLANPLKMNGCAMVLVDTPDIAAEAEAVCRWVAAHCGEAGAVGWVRAHAESR
jgi:23S rRNA (adenine2030-N6)-methyltransferase